MREIKFEYVFKNQETGNIIRERYDIISIEGISRDDIHYHAERGYKLVARRQSTGTHDKNGVEIYEGDIVEHPSFDCLLSVVYIEQETRWFALDQCDYLHELSGIIDTSKVVGNIYENPELLND